MRHGRLAWVFAEVKDLIKLYPEVTDFSAKHDVSVTWEWSKAEEGAPKCVICTKSFLKSPLPWCLEFSLSKLSEINPYKGQHVLAMKALNSKKAKGKSCLGYLSAGQPWGSSLGWDSPRFRVETVVTTLQTHHEDCMTNWWPITCSQWAATSNLVAIYNIERGLWVVY